MGYDEDIPAICSSDAFVTAGLTQDDASITQKEVHIGLIPEVVQRNYNKR
jgi:hypothetical protein